MKPSVALVSLGCPKNLVDSEVMLGLLEQAGYSIVEDTADAQVAIVSTCAFIEPAVDEAIEALFDVSELKKEGKLQGLICAGCLPQRYADDLLDELPEVDVFLTPGAVDQVVTAVQLALSGQREVIKAPLEYLYDAQTPRWRSAPSWSAHLKIAEGCDNRCAFCTVPSLRGRYRSRTISDIRKEFDALIADGVREVILVAQDTTNYGADLDPPASLAVLLGNLSEQAYDGWIRLMYMYPSRVTEQLIETIAQSEVLVPYFDIPFQHASPDLLQRMGRPGDGQVYLDKLAQIRQMIPDAALRTSLIVGLPGETEEEFELLLDFVQEARFDRLGVFPYWPEPETRAAQMPDQVPPEVARERQEELVALQEQISLENNERLVGQKLRVLVEREGTDGTWIGRSYRDAPEIDGEVILRSASEGIQPNIGEFVWATVTKAQVHDLTAVVQG